MNVLLWILQVVLAVMFLMAGVLKSTQSKDKLVPKMPSMEDFSPGTIRFIGITELAAAFGLILPAATGIALILTPLAATGLVLIMIGAMITHARRREPVLIAFNAVLLIAAVVIAWGRFGPYSL